MKTILTFIVLMSSSLAFAGTEHDHMQPAKVSSEFQNMKALIGTWEGKTKMHGQEMDAKVTYTLTSGGTALIETLGPGTPMEMVTIYASNGKKTHATHYCAIGNQPQMSLKSAKTNQFAFEMVGTQGIANKNEMHMHSVTLTVDGNKLKQEWTNFKDGKKSETAIFEFTKKL